MDETHRERNATNFIPEKQRRHLPLCLNVQKQVNSLRHPLHQVDAVRWIGERLGMVTLLGSQIWWTFETEDVFDQVKSGNKYAMKQFSKKLTQQLASLTHLVRTDLDPEIRKKVNTIMILDVHARDIIDVFVRDSILDVNDFAWESQLRFYWRKPKVEILIF